MAASPWSDLVLPKEHGSWSLALEPVALGMISAPSWAGLALSVATVAAFFTRRPLRIGVTEQRAARRLAARRAAVACGAVVLAGWCGALFGAGTGWWPWLLPSAAAGAFFLFFDLQQSGREQHAEIAGATAFAWLPAVFAALAGWPARSAAALGVIMLVRAVPTVLTVRAWLRGRKTGVRRPLLPLAAAVLAAIVGLELARSGLAPWIAAVLLVALALRSIALLLFSPATLRASTLGMIEAGVGAVFVIAVAFAWR
ncbi:MAG TPA: YwiC-like family protein [Opitutaceae bacterium]|nr:YwiC-like family protein [Opitutaceae bacterium]